MRRFSMTAWTGVMLVLVVLGGCADDATISGSPEGSAETPTLAHVPEFAWLSDRVARGGQPKTSEAFRELAEAGIRCIISVDGARPDLALAREHGLRYVHIPIGYDGVPRERQLELAKTVREIEGPFFVHCHHGKHRGPAAAVLAQMSLGDMSSEAAVAEMVRAGTAPKYAGLYACARDFETPSEDQTASLGYAFPETAAVPAFAEAMANVDRRWDGLKLVRAAGWAAPPDHPDVDPAHEALQIRELLTEMARAEEVRDRPEDFRTWLEESRRGAVALEGALRTVPVDEGVAEEAFQSIRKTCSSCHGQYRNASTGGGNPAR